MKCGAGQHKLKVYATNGRYIIRNGIITKKGFILKLLCEKTLKKYKFQCLLRMWRGGVRAVCSK